MSTHLTSQGDGVEKGRGQKGVKDKAGMLVLREMKDSYSRGSYKAERPDTCTLLT